MAEADWVNPENWNEHVVVYQAERTLETTIFRKIFDVETR